MHTNYQTQYEYIYFQLSPNQKCFKYRFQNRFIETNLIFLLVHEKNHVFRNDSVKNTEPW